MLARATELLGQETDPRVAASAHRVIALALHELDRPSDAVASFRRSLAVSVDCGFADQEALARASMAISLLTVGDMDSAGQEIRRASTVAPRSVRGVVELLRGVVAVRTGHLEQGMAAYRRALSWLAETGDLGSIARAHVCRGVVHSWQGRLELSLVDFAEAERIANEIGSSRAGGHVGSEHRRRVLPAGEPPCPRWPPSTGPTTRTRHSTIPAG